MFLPISNVAAFDRVFVPGNLLFADQQSPGATPPVHAGIGDVHHQRGFQPGYATLPLSFNVGERIHRNPLYLIPCRMNSDFGLRLLFVSLQTCCPWISVLSMGPATFLLHSPVSLSSIAAVQPPAPAAASIGHEVQPAKTAFFSSSCL